MYLSARNKKMASMRNHSQEQIADQAAKPVVNAIEEENLDNQASGSRLNPNAPDFVPSKTSTNLMTAKRINELLGYTCWSNASDEEINYGPRYDGIWRETSIQPKQTASQSGDTLSTNGDAEQSLKEGSKLASDVESFESGSIPSPNCCGSCALM